eukprot:TRINITY_DN1979_c0_g1_i2.p1 TRINITY_DN1979_c0_g1~~TRINITY_DN1979_c0_g1_i2.p1  ORF type:complete len:831 (+),score=79.25 TRINITY_DN1979_c0_g1_i2:164-2656(+)
MWTDKISDRGIEHFSKNITKKSWFDSLTVFGLNGNSEIGVEGSIHLALALKKLPKLKDLRLHDINLKEEGLRNLSKTLSQMSDIRYLSLGKNNLTSECMKDLNEALKSCGPSLIGLYLKGNDFRNASKKLSDTLKNLTSLEILSLGDCKIKDDTVKSLTPILKKLPITTLYLQNNEISSTGIKHLNNFFAYSYSLTDLNLRGNQIDHKGIESLSRAFAICENEFERFRIDKNELSNQGVKGFCSIFSNNCKKQCSIYLSRNDIGDEGVRQLAELLVDTPHLKKLDLSHNNIGENGSRFLSAAMSKLKSLEYVNLSNNTLGNNGSMCIVDSLCIYASIKTLNLAGNKICNNYREIIRHNMEWVPHLIIEDKERIEKLYSMEVKKREKLEHKIEELESDNESLKNSYSMEVKKREELEHKIVELESQSKEQQNRLSTINHLAEENTSNKIDSSQLTTSQRSNHLSTLPHECISLNGKESSEALIEGVKKREELEHKIVELESQSKEQQSHSSECRLGKHLSTLPHEKFEWISLIGEESSEAFVFKVRVKDPKPNDYDSILDPIDGLNDEFAIKLSYYYNGEENDSSKEIVRKNQTSNFLMFSIKPHKHLLQGLCHGIQNFTCAEISGFGVPKYKIENLFGEYNKKIFYKVVMKYYPKTLKDVIKAGNISDRYALIIARQLLEAVNHLNKYKYCHCDLKPDNILIDDNGEIIVTDFGNATKFSMKPSGNTRYYHNDSTVTAQYDLFSIGAILYEVVSGVNLFDVSKTKPVTTKWGISIRTFPSNCLEIQKIIFGPTDSTLETIIRSSLVVEPTKRGNITDLLQLFNKTKISDI